MNPEFVRIEDYSSQGIHIFHYEISQQGLDSLSSTWSGRAELNKGRRNMYERN